MIYEMTYRPYILESYIITLCFFFSLSFSHPSIYLPTCYFASQSITHNQIRFSFDYAKEAFSCYNDMTGYIIS